MSYKFKVGDKGLFRNGQYEYEIVAVGVQGVYPDSTAVVGIYRTAGRLADRVCSTFSRKEDGSHGSHNGLSLATPKRKVWRITARYKKPIFDSTGWTQDYLSEKKAANSFSALKAATDSHASVTMQEVEIDHE